MSQHYGFTGDAIGAITPPKSFYFGAGAVGVRQNDYMFWT